MKIRWWFFLLMFQTLSWGGQSVTLAWDPNSETDLAGYIVYWGSASRNYTNAVNVGNVTTNTVSGLMDGVSYYFAVTAYNTNGLESDFSDEVSYGAPSYPVTVVTLPPLLSPSNVVLRGTSSIAGTAWFELSAGTNAFDWKQVTALGPTNQTYWVVLTTNQMASYGGARPTNWTCRLSVSDTTNAWFGPTVSFDLRVPATRHIRIIVKVFQAVGLAGPWTEALSYTATNTMTDPPQIYRSQYSLQIIPEGVP